MKPPPHSSLFVSVLVGMVCLGGCTDLSQFSLEDDEVYRGAVFGNDATSCVDGEPCSFIRRGFSEEAVLEMQFDPSRVETEPGTLTTTGGSCEAIFEDEPLLPIVPLAHDALSLYELPGAGRIQNFIFTAHPTRGPMAGRDAMVFVSLLRSGDAEVRVIAGSGRSDCAPTDCEAFARGECDFFGVFNVQKTSR